MVFNDETRGIIPPVQQKFLLVHSLIFHTPHTRHRLSGYRSNNGRILFIGTKINVVGKLVLQLTQQHALENKRKHGGIHSKHGFVSGFFQDV